MIRRGLAALLVGSGIVAGAVGGAGAASPGTYAVGVTARTVVDEDRPTAANRGCAELPDRTLPTTVYYPATGPAGEVARPDAAPAIDDGPYPLIVFSHGYGATGETYAAMLTRWASAGYVVAAPTFPLSSGASPCGPVAGDVVNQPADVSAVIDAVLAEAKRPSSLRGMVDRSAIGAAGHSNGGITTYGVVADTKRRDRRIDAAVIMAGTAQPFPDGRYDFTAAPPLLLVHGTADTLVPYARAEDGFNAARGPKGLLTLEGGSHGAPVTPAAEGAVVDFWEAFLRDDAAAAKRLQRDEVAGVATMTFVRRPGATTTIPTQPRVVRDLEATVTPAKRLENGQQVTVTWRGYTPGQAVSILQCNPGNRDLTNSAGCDYANAKLLQPNPTGEGSVTMTVITGTVGDGVCDAAHPGCFIVVNNESSSDPSNSVILDIAFAE